MKIGIVDDHELVRNGIKRLIDEKGFNITMEAENGKDMIEQISHLPKNKIPEIIIMDINMPVMDGFEAVQWLKKNLKKIKILVLTMSQDEDRIIRMLKLGVSGYLTKMVNTGELINALKVIHSEGQYYTKEITSILIDKLKQPEKSSKIQSLTENEITFIKHACSELTYLEIANKMALSIRTIDGYRERIFAKLKIKNRVGMVLYAVKNGLIKV